MGMANGRSGLRRPLNTRNSLLAVHQLLIKRCPSATGQLVYVPSFTKERLRASRGLVVFTRGMQHPGQSMALAETDDFRDINLQTFAASALFEKTFDEGMSLVEE